MVNKEKAEALSRQKYTSSILKNFKDFFSSLFASTFSKTLNVKVENLNTKLEKEVAENTRGLKGRLDKLIDKELNLTKLESGIDKLSKKEFKVDSVVVKDVEIKNFPKPIEEIRVSNLDDIKFPETIKPEKIDFSSLDKTLSDLKSAFNSVSEYLPNLKPKEFPKITIPKTISVKEANEIIQSVESLQKTISDDLLALSKVIQAQESGMSSNDRGEVEVKVSNFPPQHIPTPVTNISINSLRGIPLSTLVSVGTSPTLLPENALSQRRSMLIFNDSGETLYIGGVNVTTSTGFPVLDQSYSPPIDAGEHMKVYGVMASGGDVRCLEVSNDSEGN